ncbi:MAG: HAD-IB family phosphatase, partial [Ignavibacteriaceae bacterium]|nr:HAD-IB family phosphatase [Ignavibacteriaceae bacterium]
MNASKIKIFIDFDGTITQEDIGESIFRHFGDKVKVDNIISDLINDKISAKMSWIELCNSINNINLGLLDQFIYLIDVDPGLHNMVKFCEDRKIQIIILSDGFDYYIDLILKRENLIGLKYYSNHLIVSQKNQLIPEFPYEDSKCRNSANCKKNHIINNSRDEDFTIYIGDGNSDKDCVQYCDLVFAKKSLLKYCEKERITFLPYNTFDDVIAKLSAILMKKHLKKR